MYNLVLPTRSGLTVGSAEFENVIKCFEIENEVVFARRNGEAKDSTTKHNGFSSGLKQRSETTGDDLDSSFKDLSLQSNKNYKMSTGTSKEKMTKPAQASRRVVRSYSTPSYISSEKFKGLRSKKRESKLRRSSANEMFSERRPPRSENREAIPNHRDEKSRETDHGLGYDKRATRIRRASLPAYVSSHRRPAISPQSPTEKMKNKGFLANADVNKKKLLQ
ncbi:Hypothetical predicted protein, partial [Paramuricea clavata]